MVMFNNADITVYHHYLDVNKLDAYSRININGVNWNSKRNSTVSDKGVNVAYTTLIIADKGTYDITIGDKVVKGNVELDIFRLSDLKAYEVLTVVGVSENNFFNTLNIECK
jgi:hypothetical protein